MKPIPVLLVDDDPAAAETYADGLKLRGVAVTLAAGVEAARQEFKKDPFPYKVVILDLWMPAPADLRGPNDAGGYQTGALLLKEFRSEFGRREPVILLSNVLDKLNESLIIGVSGVEQLDKGSTAPSDLVKVIQNLLTDGRTSGHATPPAGD